MNSLQEVCTSYINVSTRLETSLNEMHGRLATVQSSQLRVAEHEADILNNVEKIDKKFHQLKELKAILASAQFKAEMDLMQRLDIQLSTSHQKSKFNLLADMKCANFDCLKIKYLDTTCQIDQELKALESEGSSFRLLAQYTQKMLDIIKQSYKLLAGNFYSK